MLLGTTSIENSELISSMLEKEGLAHQVLNAKQHAREAEIVIQAGRPKMVTIATNMAGRGTDIVLGGNPEPEIQAIKADEALDPAEKERRVADVREAWQKLHNEVVAAGGLHIIGSERHESRRIDNQLRGRAARQGDPGSSRFFLSFEDPLLKIFAGERLQSVMRSLKIPEGEAIEAKMVTRSIENAQRKVEARNFDIRKQLLEYDDVANDQRKVIYAQRNELLETSDISPTISAIRSDVLASVVREYVPPESVEEQWDLPGLERRLEADFFTAAPVKTWVEKDESIDEDRIAAKVIELAAVEYEAKFAPIEKEVLHQYERSVMLQSIDTHWREHLAALDYLRQGIHLRGYAQKQPKQEYKREAFELFGAMLDSIKRQVTQHLMAVQIRSQAEVEEAERRAEEAAQAVKNVQYHHADYNEALAQTPSGAPEAGFGVRAAVRSRGPEGRPQRPVPLRLRQEVQELPRQARLSPGPVDAPRRLAPSFPAWTSPCAAPSPRTSRGSGAISRTRAPMAARSSFPTPRARSGASASRNPRKAITSSWRARATRSWAMRACIPSATRRAAPMR